MKNDIDHYALETIARLISDIFSLATIHLFMHIFYKKEKNRFLLIVTYLLYFLSMRCIVKLFHSSVLVMEMNLLFTFLFTYNFKSRLRTRVIVTFYLNAVTMMVETVTVNLTRFFRLNLEDSSNFTIASMLSCVIIFLVVLILKNISMLQMRAELPAALCVTVSLIPAGSIIIIFFMVVSKSCTYLFMLILTVFIFLFNIIVFKLYFDLVDKFNQTLDIKVVEQQNSYYEKQLHIMMEAQDKIRKFRHDSRTKLMILHTMLINRENDRAMEYLEEMGDDMKAKGELISTGNVAIDAVVNYKLQNISELKIHAELNVTIPEKLNIDAMDIAILLGNLLDNAIIATEKVEGERRIRLRMDYDRNVLHIHIDNPYSGRLKVFNGRYITTKKDRENHGIGLISIQQIVDKYQGVMEITHTDSHFVVEVILYLKPLADDSAVNDNEAREGDTGKKQKTNY